MLKFKHGDSTSGFWLEAEDEKGLYYLCRTTKNGTERRLLDKCNSLLDAQHRMTEIEIRLGYFSEEVIANAGR